MIGGITETVMIGDKEVTVRELSVPEVRNMLRQAEAGEPSPQDLGLQDVLGDLLFDDVRVRDLVLMTSATAEELEQMYPSELRRLADKCIEVNRYFFAMADKLRPVVDQARSEILDGLSPQTSKEPSRH